MTRKDSVGQYTLDELLFTSRRSETHFPRPRIEFANRPWFQNAKRKANCMKRGVVSVDV